MQGTSSSESGMEIIKSGASVFAQRKRRASKTPTDPTEKSLYIVELCRNGLNKDFLNLEYLVIGETGEGHCNQCIFFGIKCVWAWAHEDQKQLAKGGKITTRNCLESHWLSDIQNPNIKIYKVTLYIIFVTFEFWILKTSSLCF